MAVSFSPEAFHTLRIPSEVSPGESARFMSPAKIVKIKSPKALWKGHLPYIEFGMFPRILTALNGMIVGGVIIPIKDG